MSDIDKIFKNAIDGYEAPFNASAWDKLSDQLNNPMEDAFRNSLEGHEVPYNHNAWSALKGKIGSTPSVSQWIAGSTAAVLLVATAFILFPSSEEETSTNAIIASADNTNPAYDTENIGATNNDVSIEVVADLSNESIHNEIDAAGGFKNEEYLNNDKTHIADSEKLVDLTEIQKKNNAATTESDRIHPKDIIIDENRGSDEIIDSETVEVHMNCTAEFSLSQLEICQGETVLFDPEMSKNIFNYEWNFGDGDLSTAISAAHEFNAAGIYNIVLTIRDKNSAKILASTAKTIIVNKIPEIKFELQQVNDFIPAYSFTNESEISDNLTWRIDNRLFADKNTFEYTFKEKGTYAVQLTGENEFGCSNSFIREIVIDKDFNLGAPTAFASEGTTEYTFMPSALKIMNKEFKMIVYNPRGNPIYQTNNANEPWTGIDVNTNAAAPSGVMYTWIVYLTNANGTTDRYFGQVLKL